MSKRILPTVLLAVLAVSTVPSRAQRPQEAVAPAAMATALGDVSPNNVKLHGALLDGSPGDLARLQAVYDATPPDGTIEVPGGRWPVNNLGWALPIERHEAGKHVLWHFLGPVDAGPNAAPGSNPVRSMGDGDVTQSVAHGSLTFARRLLTGRDGETPGIEINLENHSNAFRPFAYGSGPNIPALEINAASFPGSTGQLNGLWINLYSGGDRPFASEEQGLNVLVHKTGQNSTWQISGQTNDSTGLPPKSFASIGQELDIVANGPDTPLSLYDGSKGNRVFAYYAAKTYPFPAYQANKPYAAGAKVVATADDGVKAIFIARNAGTSGARSPTWPTQGDIADGSITWMYGEPFDISVGRGIWFDGGRADPSGPHVKYSALFSSNAIIDNAAIDLSETELTGRSGAALRLAANEPIDFSGNGTAAGQNQHTLAYAGATSALTYTIRGQVALAVADTGLASFPGQIQAPLATPKSSSSPCVAGTRIADANYEYVCVATNTWKRAALSSF